MFHLDGRGRIPAIIISGGLAATLGIGAPPAHAATLGTVNFDAGRGLLTVTGTADADTIAFTPSSIGSVAVLGVDLDGDAKPDAVFPQALVKRIRSGLAGNDRLSTAEVPAGIRVQVWGGAGDDTMAGGPGNERFDGGSGADSVFGGRGNDFAALGLRQ